MKQLSKRAACRLRNQHDAYCTWQCDRLLLVALALCSSLLLLLATQPDSAAAGVASTITVLPQAYLKAVNTSADSFFGEAVGISDDTAVVGAPAEGGATGTVYVYVRSRTQEGAIWQPQATLKASNATVGDFLGRAVAIDGDTLVVGAFREDSNATGVNGDQFNDAAPDAGAAYVFVRMGATWTQQAYLKASNPDADDWFGWSVAIAGDTAVIGALDEDSNATTIDGDQSSNSACYAGAAYVFVRNGATWGQQAYLKASNADIEDFFGYAVAIAGDTVVVGAYGEDSNATTVDGDQGNNALAGAGAAYVFARSDEQGNAVWHQEAYLKGSALTTFDNFGSAVAIDGATVVIGALGDGSVAGGDNGAGAAYVFARSHTQASPLWRQQAYLTPSNRGGGDQVGVSVALAGDLLVVGALREASNATGVNGDETNNATPEAGAAYLFAREGTSWTQRAYLKASNTEAGDMFGEVVALTRDTVLIGSKWEDSNATGINGDQENNDAQYAGAAYLFTVERVTGQWIGACGGYTVYEEDGVYRAAGWNDVILVGTNRNDTLLGTAGRDLLLGLGGNDFLRGGAGDDLLCGGDGVDLLQGLAGTDYLAGGSGDDVLNGGSGDYDQLQGDGGNDVLLDGDGVNSVAGGMGNDLLTLALRNGWRDATGQPRFTGLAAGYANDAVALIILNPVRFFVALTGDEADDPASPLEGDKDLLTLAGVIDPASLISKFEKRLLVAADAEFIAPDAEAGVAYLCEAVGAEANDLTQVNRIFLPLVNR